MRRVPRHRIFITCACKDDDNNNRHIIPSKIKLRDMPGARFSRELPGTEKEERLAPTESKAQLELPCRIRAYLFSFIFAVVIRPHETVIEQTGILILSCDRAST